jgi:hypothetical protein
MDWSRAGAVAAIYAAVNSPRFVACNTRDVVESARRLVGRLLDARSLAEFMDDESTGLQQLGAELGAGPAVQLSLLLLGGGRSELHQQQTGAQLALATSLDAAAWEQLLPVVLAAQQQQQGEGEGTGAAAELHCLLDAAVRLVSGAVVRQAGRRAAALQLPVAERLLGLLTKQLAVELAVADGAALNFEDLVDYEGVSPGDAADLQQQLGASAALASSLLAAAERRLAAPQQQMPAGAAFLCSLMAELCAALRGCDPIQWAAGCSSGFLLRHTTAPGRQMAAGAAAGSGPRAPSRRARCFGSPPGPLRGPPTWRAWRAAATAPWRCRLSRRLSAAAAAPPAGPRTAVTAAPAAGQAGASSGRGGRWWQRSRRSWRRQRW